jgi:hypothetical protein
MPFALKSMDNRLGSFGRSLMSMAFFTLRPLPPRLMKYWIMGMPEPMALGLSVVVLELG